MAERGETVLTEGTCGVVVDPNATPLCNCWGMVCLVATACVAVLEGEQAVAVTGAIVETGTVLEETE